MTPFEIAIAIRTRQDDSEPLEDFVLRTMAQQRVVDFKPALDMLVGWERADEDFARLIEILEPVGRKERDATFDALIKRKREMGYDPLLEALLARRWRCPHCKRLATIETIEIPIHAPGSLARCMICEAQGIAPVDAEPCLDVRDGGKSGLRPV